MDNAFISCEQETCALKPFFGGGGGGAGNQCFNSSLQYTGGQEEFCRKRQLRLVVIHRPTRAVCFSGLLLAPVMENKFATAESHQFLLLTYL